MFSAGIGNTDNLNAAFKEVYDEGSDLFKAQQNLKAVTFSKIKTSGLPVSPQGTQIPVMMTGNESGGAINELQSIPETQSMNPQRPVVLPKVVQWSFMVSNLAIEASESNKAAFAPVLDTEQKDTMNRFLSDMNRQSFGNGFGQLATVVGNFVAVSTIVVSFINVFRRGQQIDFWDALPGAGGVKVATAFVGKVYTDGTNQIDLVNAAPTGAAVPVTVNDGYIIVKAGVLDAAPVDGKEIGGTAAICDDGTLSTTYLGLSSVTNPEWLGNVVDAGGLFITNDFMQQAQQRVRVVGGSTPKFLISGFGQQREFINQEIQKTRYEPQKIEGGTTILKYGDMEWLADKDYPDGEIGMYDLEYINKYQTRDPHLMNSDGKVLNRLQGKLAVGGTYVWNGNFGSWKRNAHVRIVNLAEPAF